ncbi:MAG: hypothetical protein V3W31_03415 [Thermodesulfobacteriota bacterium]
MRGLLAVVLLASMLFVVNQSFAGDFRESYWGMTVKQVKEKETAKPAKMGEEELFFEGELFGRKVGIIYKFAEETDRIVEGHYQGNGKFIWTEAKGFLLKSGSYVYFFDATVSANANIDEFTSLRNQLIREHGTPIYDTSIWKGEGEKPSKEGEATAVRNGQLIFLVRWKERRSNITIVLQGSNVAPEISGEIHVTYEDRFPDVNSNLTSNMQAYMACMFDAAEIYSSSDATPYEIADAAHAKCGPQFSEFNRARKDVSFYTGVDGSNEQAYSFKSRIKEKVVQQVIESRLKKGK